jgi:hypothetical protein
MRQVPKAVQIAPPCLLTSLITICYILSGIADSYISGHGEQRIFCRYMLALCYDRSLITVDLSLVRLAAIKE